MQFVTGVSDVRIMIQPFLTPALTHPSEPKPIATIMNSFHNIEKDVIVATARVRAALGLIPCITGPKEAWAIWMRDNLESDLVSDPSYSSRSEGGIKVTWFSG